MEHNDYNHDVDSAATSPLPFFQIGKLWYRDQLIRIFSDSLENRSPSQFYFDPLVRLDPKSITSRSHGSLKKEFIQITVQMWNKELRSKVLECLQTIKSLKNVEIKEVDVCVLPFKEVQLVCKSGSIRLTDQPTSYSAQPKENLGFYLLCDESFSAKLAEDFRQNPEFTLNEWQLKLECRGLSNQSGTDQTSSKRPTLSYFVSSFLNDDTASSASSVSKLVGETSSNQMIEPALPPSTEQTESTEASSTTSVAVLASAGPLPQQINATTVVPVPLEQEKVDVPSPSNSNATTNPTAASSTTSNELNGVETAAIPSTSGSSGTSDQPAEEVNRFPEPDEEETFSEQLFIVEIKQEVDDDTEESIYNDHPVELIIQCAPKRPLLNSASNSSSKRQCVAPSGLTGDEAAGSSGSTASSPIPSGSGRENANDAEANLIANEEANSLNFQHPHLESVATKLMALYSGKRTRSTFNKLKGLIKTQILKDAAAADPNLLPGVVAIKIISSITRRVGSVHSAEFKKMKPLLVDLSFCILDQLHDNDPEGEDGDPSEGNDEALTNRTDAYDLIEFIVKTCRAQLADFIDDNSELLLFAADCCIRNDYTSPESILVEKKVECINNAFFFLTKFRKVIERVRLSRNAAKKEQQIKGYIFKVMGELTDSPEYDEKDILPSYTKYLKAFEMNKSMSETAVKNKKS